LRSRLKHFGMAAAPAILGMQLLSSTPVFAQDDPQSLQGGDITPERSLTFEPRVPLDSNTGLVAGGLVGGLALAFALYASRRRVKTALPTTLAGGAIALGLFNPVLSEREQENMPRDIVVVIDKSASNVIGQRKAVTDEVQRYVDEQLGSFENVNIRIVSMEEASGELVNSGSMLFESLKQTEGLNPDYMAGIVVITDGQIHDAPETSPYGPNVPVTTLLTGGEGEFDRSVELKAASTFGLVDEEETIRFQINDYGISTAQSASINVNILSGDNTLLSSLSVMPGEVIEAKVPLTNTGDNIFVIETLVQDNELTDENNRLVVNINGIRESLNVLMVSGAINDSVRTLRDIYKSDTNSNLIQLMSMRLPLQLDNTPRTELALTPVPLNDIFGEALEKYDLIAFNNYEDFKALPSRYIKELKKRSESDGALLVTVGPEFAGSKSIVNTPLGDLIPVVPTGEIKEELFLPQLTEEGFKHPITRSLNGAGAPDAVPEWGRWIRVMGAEVEEGRVLMETPSGEPLLVTHETDSSRVAVLLSDSFPLWGQGFDGGGPEKQMITRLSHWLMRMQGLEEEALRVSATNDGQLVIERQTMQDGAPPAVIIDIPNGDDVELDFKTEISPGLWRVEYQYPDDGVYGITNQNAEDTLSAYIYAGKARTKEMENVISTSEILKPIADETGAGIFYTVQSDGSLKIPELRMIEPSSDKNIFAGEDWAGFSDKKIQELRKIEKNSLLPDWATALFVAAMMAWGWSRENDHDKIRKLMRRRSDDSFGNKSVSGKSAPSPDI
jgi:hypothetical protein